MESPHPSPCFFQDDKDLVHEFVVAEGLTCLIKVGAEADQNYQNYILRGTSALFVFWNLNARPLANGGCCSSAPSSISSHESTQAHVFTRVTEIDESA